MDMLDKLLDRSGHYLPPGPFRSNAVLSVLDTEIATWPITRLREIHSKKDIHIVPKDPSTPMAFTASTCEALGINLDQSRQVHGMLFRSM